MNQVCEICGEQGELTLCLDSLICGTCIESMAETAGLDPEDTEEETE